MDQRTVMPCVGSVPDEKVRGWVVYHHEYVAPDAYAYDFVWDITAESKDPFYTNIGSNVLLDSTNHVTVVPFGCNSPKLTDRMVEFDLMDPTKIVDQDFYVSNGSAPGKERLPGPAALMDRLVDPMSRYGVGTVFLSDSGAEIAENAIKIAYSHADGAKHGIAFKGAFYGRILDTLSFNHSEPVYRRKFPEISGVLDVPFCDDRTCSPETCSCGFFPGANSAVSKLRQEFHPRKGHIDASEVTYVIIEPIQGEDGYRFPSGTFVEGLAAVVSDYGLTLIADEIQTGVGRTGELRDSDRYPLESDVITGAEGLHVGTTISNSGIFPDEASRLSSTWDADDTVSLMQGVFTPGTVEEYDLLNNAIVRNRQFVERMRDDAPSTIVDAYGKGLSLAVKFNTKERRNVVQEAALKCGLLTLSCGHKVSQILPSLDMTAHEISLGAMMLLDAIEDAP